MLLLVSCTCACMCVCGVVTAARRPHGATGAPGVSLPTRASLHPLAPQTGGRAGTG
ncbi:hypothetical protein FM105_11295 [Brevibacterium yomogidense]|uniref:Uncharacterized protein n=1 Tax=Brevibacterium yomogidense TaxID=946573 RepID=A0A1X6XJP2_9MICO|nr:hypothetical protein FM105_11295 [Brevibacterium yomogidense]